jgi:predicted porin
MDTGLNAASGGLGNLLVASNAAEAKTGAYLLSVNYDWNDLSVGGVYAKSSNANAKALELTDVAVGGSYDLKVVKLFATYQTTKNATVNAATDKALSFSAVAPVGPGAVLASYAKSTIGASTAGSATASVNGSSYTVGYLQGLSKATTAYVALSKSTNGTNGTLYGVANDVLKPSTAGGSATMLAIGLNKKF